jgi:hypothetical protein
VWMPGGADPVHCEGCGYETERPDLSCVLISLLALFPRLKRLEVFTKVGGWQPLVDRQAGACQPAAAGRCSRRCRYCCLLFDLLWLLWTSCVLS